MKFDGEAAGVVVVIFMIIGGFFTLFLCLYFEEQKWSKNKKLLKSGKISIHTLIMKMMFEKGCVACAEDLAPHGPPYHASEVYTPLSRTGLTAEKILAVMLSEPGYYTPDLTKPKRHSVNWEPGKITVFTPFELNSAYRNVFAENLYGDDFELQEKIRDKKLELLIKTPGA